jgi:hypothetical protein
MLLMVLGALGVAWLVAAAIVVALCVSAARADRDDARRVSEPRQTRRAQLRLIA